jgi:hypothetical protein
MEPLSTINGIAHSRRGRNLPGLVVAPSPVEPVDVLGDGDLDVVDGGPRALVTDQLGLQPTVEWLRKALWYESPASCRPAASAAGVPRSAAHAPVEPGRIPTDDTWP